MHWNVKVIVSLRRVLRYRYKYIVIALSVMLAQ